MADTNTSCQDNITEISSEDIHFSQITESEMCEPLVLEESQQENTKIKNTVDDKPKKYLESEEDIFEIEDSIQENISELNDDQNENVVSSTNDDNNHNIEENMNSDDKSNNILVKDNSESIQIVEETQRKRKGSEDTTSPISNKLQKVEEEKESVKTNSTSNGDIDHTDDTVSSNKHFFKESVIVDSDFCTDDKKVKSDKNTIDTDPSKVVYNENLKVSEVSTVTIDSNFSENEKMLEIDNNTIDTVHFKAACTENLKVSEVSTVTIDSNFCENEKMLETDNNTIDKIPFKAASNEYLKISKESTDSVESDFCESEKKLVDNKNTNSKQEPFNKIKPNFSTPQNSATATPTNASVSSIDNDTPDQIKKNNYQKPLFINVMYTVHGDSNREISNIFYEEMIDLNTKRPSSGSCGILADVSKSLSSGSSISVPSIPTMPLSYQQRLSTASTASARFSIQSRASINSSMSSLNRGSIAPLHVQSIDMKLSESKIKALKNRWTNADQLYGILEVIEASMFDSSPIPPVNLVTTSTQTESNVLSSITEVDTPKSSAKRAGRKTSRTPSVSSSTSPVLEPKKSFPVFARWADKKYYSGTAQETPKQGKWMVSFDDGNKKIVSDEFVLKVEDNKLLKGHSVHAVINEDGDFASGVIAEVKESSDTTSYKIDTEDGKEVCATPDKLFLTDDQVKWIKESIPHVTPPSTPKRGGVVSLDNIVDGKRSTRSSRRKNNDSPRPGTSGVQQKLTSVETINSDSPLEEVGGVEPELRTCTPKAKTKTIRGKGLVKSKLFSEDNLLGPIPSIDSNLFAGLCFLLTCVRTPQKKTLQKNEDVVLLSNVESASETETETMEFTKTPYVEERLRLQLTSGGGIVYDHFEQIPKDEYKNCKLITNRPNKTAKFIQSIAAGIEIVSHEWVIICCQRNEKRKPQTLPLGWSIKHNRFMDAFSRVSLQPLEGMLIAIAPNRDIQFVTFWRRVCELAGGVVLELSTDCMEFQHAAFVLADNECPDNVIDRAREWTIPLLSTHWVVQTLIHGNTQPFEGVPQFCYSYIDSD